MIEKIYVINMKKDVEKLEHFKKEVTNQFEFHIIEGVDPLSEQYKTEFDSWIEKNNIHINYETFDWKYYIDRYPDLKQNRIHTKKDAWLHWINFGKKEMRSCYKNNDIVNKGQWGCLMSHIQVLKHALENNYESIIIFEDDVILTKPWSIILTELEKINNSDRQLIYLGSSQYEWKNIVIEDGVYHTNNSFGTFAYMVKRELYSVLLELFEQKIKPVDNYLVDFQNQNQDHCVVMYPNMVICDLEKSAISYPRKNEEFYKKFRWS